MPSWQGLDGFVVDTLGAASVLKEPGCCSRSPQYRVHPTRAVLLSMPMGQSPALGVITTTKDPENIWKVRLKGNILVPCNKWQTCSGSNYFQMAPDLFFHPIYNTKKSHIENKAPRCLQLLLGTISFKKKVIYGGSGLELQLL